MLPKIKSDPAAYYPTDRWFIQFLKKYGVTDLFSEEFMRSNGDRPFVLNLVDVPPSRYIIYAIDIRSSAYGEFFWKLLHEAWLDFLDGKIIAHTARKNIDKFLD
ncbi:hypothetical protein [Sigmofec virus UA08Rod_4820]|uniref:Uncharacterized protein n=1 Tax=Sigmofec virus UA08Rod_4820 TaxID=2929410 RepID=A0A976R8M6_9VIRU|nr:hypothetical protein [Sigmofec virus UA08Rod_4820]